MQDTLIVILSFFVLPNFHRIFLLSFLISKNTKSSLEEGFRLTQIMWVVLAVAVLIFLFSS
jgi:type II secretory pathway component PulF